MVHTRRSDSFINSTPDSNTSSKDSDIKCLDVRKQRTAHVECNTQNGYNEENAYIGLFRRQPQRRTRLRAGAQMSSTLFVTLQNHIIQCKKSRHWLADIMLTRMIFECGWFLTNTAFTSLRICRLKHK